MKLKMILAMVLAIVLLAGCSSAPKKEESKPAASESSKEESSKKEESSSKTEVSEEEEDEEETVEETPEEEAPEEEEEEEQEAAPQPETSEAEGEAVNHVYRQVGKDAPEGTLLILINEPDEAFLYATRVSDEFDLTTLDRVMLIPRYEHSSIRLWTLKTEFSDDGETAMQVHDEMLYEIEDSTLDTVLLTSIPRIEDSARYAVEITTPHGDGEYYFNFYGDDLPQIEYIEAAKG
ncbi:MAG: hypothetical protein K6A77_01020 [Clostridiales bacterium]|nr:hypothetical protein [Clostridiales bacterium]